MLVKRLEEKYTAARAARAAPPRIRDSIENDALTGHVEAMAPESVV